MGAGPQLYEGRQQLTANWSVALPFPMAMPIDDGSLVFWHAPERLTVWFTVAQGVPGARGLIALDELKESVPDAAFDIIEDRERGLLLYSYRVDEGGYQSVQPSLYGFAVAGHGEHVIFAGYFDTEAMLVPAMRVWRSIEWREV